jgi:alpha/beta superfamily hydrolase
MEVFFDGPAGRLQGLYHPPRGLAEGEPPRAVAPVCHPHPRPDLVDPNTTHPGGNMHSTVTFKTARALQNAGIACLRFNFRGVQESEGVHDGQGAEEGDVEAAIGWLQERHPGLSVWAGGFSFGSRTVFGLAQRDPRLERLVLVGFPVRAYSLEGVDRLTQPTLMVWGGEDEFGTDRDLRDQYPALPDTIRLERVEGADHFFMGGATRELEARVHAWAAEQLGLPQP